MDENPKDGIDDYRSEEFSPKDEKGGGDIGYVEGEEVDGYVITPSGRMMFYSYEKSSVDPSYKVEYMGRE